MTCEKCGGSLAAGAKFCPSCGGAVTGGATASMSPASLPTMPAPPVSTPMPSPQYAVPPPPPAAMTLPPAAGYAYPPAPRTNGLAIAAMVLGILWLYWLGSILALIFGYVAKNQIDRSGGQQGGRGMAIAGIVLGWVGVAVLSLIVIAAIAASSNT